MTEHFTLPRQRAEDDSGNPISGAKLYFFDVGTTNPRTVYQDYNLTTAHGVFVQADANGVFDPIYPPNGDYDVLMTDGSDAGNDYTAETTIRAKISTKGPVDLSSFQTNMAKSETPAITKATDYTVVEADRGKAIDVNPNSATVTITLESSAVAGDGSEITIKHNGNSNAVILSTVNGELIDGHARYVLVRPDSSVTLRADGANWKIKSETIPNAAILHSVANRNLTSPPTSPTDGSKYIISDSSLVGQWASYSSGDLVIYAGSGVYQLIVKLPGDRAYIVSENMDTRWTGSAWEDLSNITAPNETALETARFELRRPLGSSGKAVVTNAWTSRGYMVELSNYVTGLSIDSEGIMTFEAGTYYINATQVQYSANEVRTRFVCLNNPAIKIESEDLRFAVAMSMQVSLSGTIVVTEAMVAAGQNTFDHQYYRTNSLGDGLGDATNIGEHEHYGNVQVINLKSIQGPRGDQGSQGFPGADGAPGAPGADGSDGVSSIFNDASEPAGGNNGDIWIRSTDGQYFKRIGGAWVDQSFSLKGNPGANGADGATGATGINWLGTWSAGTYNALDAVYHNGSSFIATTTTAQTPPHADWNYIAIKGDAGSGLADVVDDTTPQLGGNLDCNNHNITGLNIGSDSAGDILYNNGSSYTRLPVGSNGEVLKIQAGAPSWQAESGGSSVTSEFLALALQVADLEGDAYELSDGIRDPYDDQDDVDTVNSTGLNYSDNDYSTMASETTVTASPFNASSSTGAEWTYVDRTVAILNSVDVQTIGVHSDTARTINVKIVQRTSAGNYTVVVNEALTHGGTGYEDLTLSSPYSVPASGDFYLSSNATGSYSETASVTRAYVSGNVTGSVSMTEDSGPVQPMRYSYIGASGNLVLISNSFTASSAPSTARLLLQIKPVDAITINTDLIASVSRDGGTTWTPAILTDTGISYSDGTKMFEDANVDISGQPSGVSMEYKIETLNSKNLSVRGTVFQWS